MFAEKRVVIVFLKWPEPGAVKTRLAKTCGDEKATSIYRMLVERVVDQLPDDASIRFAFTPESKRESVKKWLLPKCSLSTFVPQSSGDLGDRLSHAVSQAFADGYTKVVVMGTDCIDIDESILTETWHALKNHECVFGPTEDGGYYLLGLSSPIPELFDAIPWSTPQTLSASLEQAKKAQRSVHLLGMLTDIDHYEDWEKVAAQFSK